MKRFTETTKWRDPWFRKLSLRAKALFLWLTDNCDNAGVIHLDLEAASFDIGEAVKEQHVAELESRLKRLPNGKIWIRKFIPFQYNNLSAKCVPHLRVIESLQAHGISYPDTDDLSTRVDTTLPSMVEATDKERKGQGQGQGMEGGVGETFYSPESRVAIHWLNEKSGKHFRECESSLAPINARLKESGVDIDGVKKMIERQCSQWKGTKLEEYLRPQTLFGKEKFDGYYAARDTHIISDTGFNGQPVAKPGLSMLEKEIARINRENNL